MRAGELNQPVYIFRRATTPNASGDALPAEVSVGRRWAKLRPLRAGEYVQDDQVNGAADHEFTFRGDAAGLIDSTCVLKLGQRRFEVSGIQAFSRQEDKTIVTVREKK